MNNTLQKKFLFLGAKLIADIKLLNVTYENIMTHHINIFIYFNNGNE